MIIKIKICDVQHLKSLNFSIDLSKNSLVGIVGRNSVGKTTLMKALLNLKSADTFTKTSSEGIFTSTSAIEYDFDGKQIHFIYDPKLNTLNSKNRIDENLRTSLDVELPLPFGLRFNFYKSISDADSQIRQAVVLGKHKRPIELIDFLNSIYGTQKFNDLVEISIKNIPHYCILLPESRYIREDYLSSGEFFLIHLYRKIQSRCKLIAIDEIDISLDAAAQVHLIQKLRFFCKEYDVNILFTTHSLAMMRTLNEGELFSMQNHDGVVEVVPHSYAYLKSTLFGFKGWDRYILTEDLILKNFLEYLINRYCISALYEFKIIFVGTYGSVISLMSRNETEEFFHSKENVISILDGDVQENSIRQMPKVFVLPIDSVEKYIFDSYNKGELPTIKDYVATNNKKLFAKLISTNTLTEKALFDHICDKEAHKINIFAQNLISFLSKNISQSDNATT